MRRINHAAFWWGAALLVMWTSSCDREKEAQNLRSKKEKQFTSEDVLKAERDGVDQGEGKAVTPESVKRSPKPPIDDVDLVVRESDVAEDDDLYTIPQSKLAWDGLSSIGDNEWQIVPKE